MVPMLMLVFVIVETLEFLEWFLATATVETLVSAAVLALEGLAAILRAPKAFLLLEVAVVATEFLPISSFAATLVL